MTTDHFSRLVGAASTADAGAIVTRWFVKVEFPGIGIFPAETREFFYQTKAAALKCKRSFCLPGARCKVTLEKRQGYQTWEGWVNA